MVDPAFFVALKKHLPKISEVRIHLKRGTYHNELTRFRYDAIIKAEAQAHSPDEIEWIDWTEQGLTLGSLRQLLAEGQPEMLGVARAPNARLLKEVHLLDLLESDSSPQTAGDLRKALDDGLQNNGVDPEKLWSLSEDFPYLIDINWSSSGADGSFDVVFGHRAARAGDHRRAAHIPEEATIVRSWSEYANNPLKAIAGHKLAPQLRRYLQEKLPDYMVPSAFMILDALPLTSNGKVDRQALPALDQLRPEREGKFVAASTEAEKMLTDICSQVLGVDGIGIHDNFFELGGNSLLATQLISRLREAFQVDLPLRSLFESPTIASLAGIIEVSRHTEQGELEKVARMLKKLEDLSEDEVETMLAERTKAIARGRNE